MGAAKSSPSDDKRQDAETSIELAAAKSTVESNSQATHLWNQPDTNVSPSKDAPVSENSMDIEEEFNKLCVKLKGPDLMVVKRDLLTVARCSLTLLNRTKVFPFLFLLLRHMESFMASGTNWKVGLKWNLSKFRKRYLKSEMS